jgi:hypothetical protein
LGRAFIVGFEGPRVTSLDLCLMLLLLLLLLILTVGEYARVGILIFSATISSFMMSFLAASTRSCVESIGDLGTFQSAYRLAV